VSDYKQLIDEAEKRYMVEKVFIRKERSTVYGKTPQEAAQRVQAGAGRHAGQTPEVLAGIEVTEIGINKKVEDEEGSKDDSILIVPTLVP